MKIFLNLLGYDNISNFYNNTANFMEQSSQFQKNLLETSINYENLKLDIAKEENFLRNIHDFGLPILSRVIITSLTYMISNNAFKLL